MAFGVSALAEQEEAMESGRRTLVGRVVSDKMQKTIVVVVETRKRHPLYGKVVRNVKRFKAHDEENTSAVGDLVRIVEWRPLSHGKRWMLEEVLERAE
jgi:small subunit ribosomal protein S17